MVVRQNKEFDYVEVMDLLDQKKERPKFFAKQLHCTLIMANTLVHHFSSSSQLSS